MLHNFLKHATRTILFDVTSQNALGLEARILKRLVVDITGVRRFV